MDHVVYLDKKACELENLISGKKTMIIRGAAGRKLPYGRVEVDDTLYFINNNAEGEVKAKAVVVAVQNLDKMTNEDSKIFVEKHQKELQLSDQQFKRWAGKRYIVLVRVSGVELVKPFEIDKSHYGNMDDWLPVGEINKVAVV